MKTNDEVKTQLESQIENWVPMKENPAYYVSDLGNVRNQQRLLNPMHNGGKRKYLFVKIDGKKHYIHQLVLSNFVGDKPEGYECDHEDCDRTNNVLTNLRYLTIQENRSRGRIGADNPSATLTDEKVSLIRKLYSEHRKLGITFTKLANLFDISHTQVHRIIRRKQWLHI